VSLAFVSRDAAVARLGDRLPVVAAAYGLSVDELQQMLRAAWTLAVD